MPSKNSKPKKHKFVRFFIVLAVLFAYAGFTMHQYGVQQGLSVTVLTWAFFLFATPIADAGFLVAFPVRLATGFRMLYTQIATWILGAGLVAYFLIFDPASFHKTGLLELFHTILVHPWPLGPILVLSFIGTYVNIIFDDDIVDVAGAKVKNKQLPDRHKQLYVTLATFAVTIAMYIVLLHVTHTNISWF